MTYILIGLGVLVLFIALAFTLCLCHVAARSDRLLEAEYSLMDTQLGSAPSLNMLPQQLEIDVELTR